MKDFNDQIEILRATKSELDSKKDIYNLFCLKIHYDVSISTINKTLKILENYNEESLMEIYANIRFLLETLINLRLFNQEDRYIYIFYFSIFVHKRDKTKKFISQLETEIKALKEFEAKEHLNIPTKHELENDSDFEKQMTVFSEGFRENGFGYQAHLLETQVLPKYKEELQIIIKQLNEASKEILKDKIACSLFDFRKQKSRVFKQFKDDRKWREKANDAGLTQDYDFLYNISSSLIHSTSYSILTTQNTAVSDIEFCKRFAKQYTAKIALEIKTLTKFDKITKGLIII